jgi:hypothetical protein
LSSVPLLGTDSIVSDMAVTPDGRYALFTDNGLFSTHGVGVAALSVGAVSLLSSQPYLTLDGMDPALIVASPHGNALLVGTAGGGSNDGVRRITYDDANPTAPFADSGNVAYAHGRPGIPTVGVVVTRGSLIGTAIIKEYDGLRVFRFNADGTVTDVAEVPSREADLGALIDGLGLQP